MRKTIAILFFFPLLGAFAQSGTVKESLSVPSKILGKTVEYSIYLPAGYDQTNRSYPVLYLLHGYTDDETGWTQFGEVQKIADQMNASTEVTPMIIAMPDGGVDWYINSYDGKTKYEDFFIKEFIPFIEKTYRARAEKRYRAVAGLSMGGHGTLIYALKHPEMFAAAAPLSAKAFSKDEIIEQDEASWERVFGFVYGPGLVGEERITSHLKNNTGLFLVENGDPEALRKVRFYIDCGDDDFLIKGNLELHARMLDKKIPHEFRVRDGVHNWTYWRTALPEVLKFVSVSFHQ
ncbi:MAG: esterase family protein [Cyclobacteriaceae bacterium]|nr:esterase family protein [Cyclobacteriaceae bacterium]